MNTIKEAGVFSSQANDTLNLLDNIKKMLKEMVQSYVPHDEYILGFQSCFEEEIGYVDRKLNECYHEYLGYESVITFNGYDMDDMDGLLSLHQYKHKRSVRTDTTKISLLFVKQIQVQLILLMQIIMH